MALIDGDDLVSGDLVSIEEENRIKNHWRLNIADLTNPSEGMVKSTPVTNLLEHCIADSTPGPIVWAEIVQGDIPLSDEIAIVLGTDSDASIEYEETTNQALIFGIPVAAERGVIICRMADIAIDFTGEVTASAQPVFWFIDADTDSYLGVGHQGDDHPGIWSGPDDSKVLAIQYDANADVTVFENSADGENRDFSIWGWITEKAGGAGPLAGVFRMEDTNNEFVIEAQNDTGHEGVTISLLETNQRFRIRQNADILSMYLDDTDAFIKWSDGSLILMTDEGMNTVTTVEVHGKGNQYGQFLIYDLDDDSYLGFSWIADDQASIDSNRILHIKHTTAQDIKCWSGIDAGNPYFYMYGWITEGGTVRYGRFRMDDTFNEFYIEAEANANHEGITVSLLEAAQEFRIRGVGGAERFWIDQTGIVGYMRVGELRQWTYQGDLADDASFTLPAFTDACWGMIQAGNNEEYALFSVDNDGDVTLISNSANVVANADTDGKLCLGILSPEEPLTVKNALGAQKNINLIIWYS